MSSGFNSQMISALDAFNEDFRVADPDQGGRRRPPRGDWVSLLRSCEVEAGNDVTVRVAEGREIPGFLVKFDYELVGDAYPLPPDFKKGDTYPGKAFALPAQPLKSISNAPKNKLQNWEITTRRLKGHVAAILGDKATGNLSADLAAIKHLIATEAVLVRVKSEWQDNDKDPDKPYYEEKIMRREA